ncbi:hypothetical protein PEC18_09165 [Paucibacter sp. O1-1]|nr:hypothetical protein [Paucibacter sp. O1-1]MDA3826021.1 hypothetical protein [Paucibacter sp. O1-1]
MAVLVRCQYLEGKPTHDELRRPYTQTTQQWSRPDINIQGAGTAMSVTTHYDRYFGRVKGVTYNDSRLRIRTKYNRYGEVIDLQDNDNGAWLWSIDGYDAWGQPTRQQYGNGVCGFYSSNPKTGQSAKRAWHRHCDTASAKLDEVNYTYDALGNLATQQRGRPTVAPFTATESYGYDRLQRLLSASPTTAAPVNYSYDQIGNLTQKTDYAQS